MIILSEFMNFKKNSFFIKHMSWERGSGHKYAGYEQKEFCKSL